MATDPSFVPSNVSIEVEGDITVPGAPDEEEEPSTLDEPVLETLVSLPTSVVALLFIYIFCLIWSIVYLKYVRVW